MTLAQAKKAAPLHRVPGAANYYGTTKPPRPVYPFQLYALAVGEATGVCGVVAQTAPYPDGSKTYKDMVEVVFKMLINRYGDPTHTGETDTARTVKWTDAQGPSTSVQATVHHAGDGTAYIQVAYSFSNLRECNQELLQGL